VTGSHNTDAHHTTVLNNVGNDDSDHSVTIDGSGNDSSTHTDIDLSDVGNVDASTHIGNLVDVDGIVGDLDLPAAIAIDL
jgi:hypothetical protein